MDPVAVAMSEAYAGQRQCYGIDAEGSRVVIARAVRARRGPAEVVFEGDAAADAASLASWATRIQAEAETGRACIMAAMPVASSFVRWLQTPFTSRRKAEKVLPSLFDVQLPCPLEKCVYGFMVGGATAGGVGATALAARREDIERRLAAFLGQGLDPDGLDHEGLALLRYSLRGQEAADGEVRVVASVGGAHSSFVVGDRTGMRSAHSAQVGSAELLASDPKVREPARRRFLQRALQVRRAALSDPGSTALRWMWVGPGVEDRQWLAEVENELGGDEVTFGVHREPGRFLARALAELPVLDPGGGGNFLSNLLEHRRTARRRQSRKVSTMVLALSLGAAVCAANVAWRAALDRRKAALQDQVTALTARLTGMPPASARAVRGQEVRVVREQLATRTSFNTAFLDVFGPSLTEPLSRILATAAAEDVGVSVLTLGRDRIDMSGAARTIAGCETMEKTVRALGYDIAADVQEGAAGADVRFGFKGGRAR
jgi:hypothetical protein